MVDTKRALEILGGLSAELSTRFDVESLLERFAAAAFELTECSDVAIWQIGPGESALTLATVSPADSPLLQHPVVVEQKLTEKILQDRKTLLFNKAGRRSASTQSNGFDAVLGLPLIWRDELQGIMVAGYRECSVEVTVPDQTILELLASQAAAALCHHQLSSQNDQLKQSLMRERERLLHVQGAIRQMLDQPDTGANLIEVVEALEALGWQRVILALFSQDMTVAELITVGVSSEEKRALRSEVIPAGIWQRFLNDDLEDRRVNGMYYICSSPDQDGWQAGDVLFIPLRLGQREVVGVIRVEQPVNPTAPTPETLRPVDILASQAAYIIENARLLNETSRSATALAEQVDELSMIHQADRELSAHLNMDRVMTLTMDWALRRTGADTGLLALTTDDKRGLIPLIKMGYLDRQIVECNEQNPWALDRGIMEKAVRTGHIQVVRDATVNSDAVPFMPGSRAQISVPLSMRGEVLGVITLGSSDELAFDENNAGFLERLARRAAVALDNARLFRQAEQLADDMAVLYSASRAITASLERDDVLQQISQSMAVALECSSAVIFDYKIETAEAEVLAVYKVGTAKNARESLPEVNSVVSMTAYPAVRRAVEQHRTLILRTIDPVLSEPERNYMLDHGISAMIFTPLVAQQELIGLAVVIEGRRDRVFTSNEIFKAETLASQASVALRQSLLYSDILELEKVKSEMIRMASHDLRNPLNIILGYVELIEVSLEDIITPSQYEYLANLRRSASMMQSLIEDLLSLERAHSERESEWQPFDLGGLVFEVVEAEQASAALKNQKLVLKRDPDTPWVIGSMTQLRQAISNLIGNAIKYTPENGVILVRFVHEGGRLTLTVQDNGYGISPDRQRRIFERFYRAREPGTEDIPGTGLGLNLVKTVVERHGGLVWFNSEQGAGSTFGFWVPTLPDSKPD